MLVFEATSADRAWLLSVAALKDQAERPSQDGRGGPTHEILHAAIQLHDPRRRWVVSRQPALSVAFSVVEVIGILNGRRDSGYLNFFNPALPNYAGSGTNYHGAYGFRLRFNLGFDQLERAAHALRRNPEGRQIVLQIWDSAKDFPRADGTPVAEDIPCNVCSLLKVREGKLEWSQIMRSNDVYRGLPYNLVQFTTLQEVVAGWIGVEPGTYTHFADSLHLYQANARNAFSSQYLPVEEASDNLALPKAEADAVWAEMNRRVDLLVTEEMTERKLRELVYLNGAPQSFTNLMTVVVADAARRRRDNDLANSIMLECTNPVLQFMWKRWSERCAQRLVKN